MNESGDNLSLLNYSDMPGIGNDTEPPCKFQVYTLIVQGVLTGLICIFGLFGNITAFCVFQFDKMKTSTSFLFQGLAVIDSILLMIALPTYSFSAIADYIGTNRYMNTHTFLVVYFYAPSMMCQTGTIWVTVLVGMNRFIAVCMPYRAPRLCTVNQAKKQLAIVIMCAIIFNLPHFFSRKAIYDPKEKLLQPSHTKFYATYSFATVYSNFLYMIINIIIPLLILIVLNICLILTLRELKRKRQEMQSLRQQQDNNVTFVLIIVVIVFIVCQIPAFITQLFWTFLGEKARDCGGIQFFFGKLSNMLVIFNSACNFAIYFAFNTRFRQVLLQCCCRQDYQSVRTTTVQATVMTRTASQEKKANAPVENHSDKEKVENGDGSALL